MKQKIAEALNILFGFRKFVLMLFVFLVAVIFRCKDLINGSEMVDLLKSTVITFLGANGVEHVVGAVKDHYASKTLGDDPATAYEDLITPVAQETEDLKAESENAKS